jgi:hypothetical protein
MAPCVQGQKHMKIGGTANRNREQTNFSINIVSVYVPFPTQLALLRTPGVSGRPVFDSRSSA